ncbi:MAG: winged helix-turn-helix domain-containing protein [Thermoanaerobaculia bacterium]|nr:winged helix-turn-helix domain-containing protein [Thermoanaerobaculia bacterium]
MTIQITASLDELEESPAGHTGTQETDPIYFGDFAFDRQTGELLRAGRPCPIRPLAARALQYLIEHRHRLVTRQELRQHLGGDSAIEWQTGLYQIVRQLRSTLEDDPRSGDFILTVPRRGYRWTAPSSKSEPASQTLSGGGESHRTSTHATGDSTSVARRWKQAGFYLAGIATLPVAIVFVCVLVGLTQ